MSSDQELLELHRKCTGFIFNDFGTKNKHYPFNKLHFTKCRHVKRTDTKTGKYYFDSIEEARDWLESNRGVEGEKWHNCGSCM
jgi:hypothetical protein